MRKLTREEATQRIFGMIEMSEFMLKYYSECSCKSEFFDTFFEKSQEFIREFNNKFNPNLIVSE